ncbi:unnamed protein product, partial [marine sediment metagenome]
MRLEKLFRKLYQRKPKDKAKEKEKIFRVKKLESPQTTFRTPRQIKSRRKITLKKLLPFKKKIIFLILILAGVVFGLVVLFSFLKIYSFSAQKIELTIEAQREISAGEEIIYWLRWQNLNRIKLEKATLIFQPPEGFVSQEEIFTFSLGEIPAQSEGGKKILGRIYGKKNEEKKALAKLTFHPQNLSASFEKKAESLTVITSIPILLDLD